MTVMESQSDEVRVLVDNNEFGEFRMPVHGTETVAVRRISPHSVPLLVEISIGQVTLYGPLPAIRERLDAMPELLDRVVAEPGRWGDVRLTKGAPGRWKRLRPHPFVNRPTKAGPTSAGADPERDLPSGARGRIIPI